MVAIVVLLLLLFLLVLVALYGPYVPRRAPRHHAAFRLFCWQPPGSVVVAAFFVMVFSILYSLCIVASLVPPALMFIASCLYIVPLWLEFISFTMQIYDTFSFRQEKNFFLTFFPPPATLSAALKSRRNNQSTTYIGSRNLYRSVSQAQPHTLSTPSLPQLYPLPGSGVG